MFDVSKLFVSSRSSIRAAIECIDHNEKQIALVVDEDERLIDTITDGDIRRAILAGIDLDESVALLRQRKSGSLYTAPVTAAEGTELPEILELMKERCVRHVPILDESGRVKDIITYRDVLKSEPLPIQVVVMAGGYGTRLKSLTGDMPKTMLHIGDRPLLESIMKRLRDSGIKRVNLATHYKSEAISRHFGDGSKFGLEIRYVKEDQPLGTAGALSLLGSSKEPLLVMNGDILTQVDFRAMLNFHVDHAADMTVAVKPYEYRIPYGVVSSRGIELTGITEKPLFRQLINAGIYLLDPKKCLDIPRGQNYDMTDLIAKLIEKGQRVICFPIREYWLDIGRPSDYEKAKKEYRQIFEKDME